MEGPRALRDEVESGGYAVREAVLGSEEVERLGAEVDALLAGLDAGRGGVRGVLAKSSAVSALAREGAAARLAALAAGAAVWPVRATVFDKTPAANWKVPWHQDLTIAVRERIETPGFGPWSTKDGTVHVQAPAEVLSTLVAVRVHLDDTPADNGALRVVPGSHRAGRLADERIARLREDRGEVVCPVGRGGAMVMVPLLLHASSAASEPRRRRVIHIDYASEELPGALEWAE
jgi:ectoine hydroxylase-related dioxygenase (phytanoyl-CoA dioxygenase family)